jgi:hypothetical protein
MRSNFILWFSSFVICIGLLSWTHSEEEKGKSKSNSESKVNKTDTNSVQITELIDPVEIQPSYPGGQKQLQEFIRNNLHYQKMRNLLILPEKFLCNLWFWLMGRLTVLG